MSVNEKSEFKMKKIKGDLKIGIFVLVLSFFSACTILYEIQSNPFPFYYIPHFLQPSYYQAKRMCRVNNMPDGEEKINKILSYFDESFDDIDWAKFNKFHYDFFEEKYLSGKLYYAIYFIVKHNWRIDKQVTFYANKPEIKTKEDVKKIELSVYWDTNTGYYASGRLTLGRLVGGMEKIYLNCSELLPD